MKTTHDDNLVTILSIDGGGIRGITILEFLEFQFELTNSIIGTGWGGCKTCGLFRRNRQRWIGGCNVNCTKQTRKAGFCC